jgi:hypothetical protein
MRFDTVRVEAFSDGVFAIAITLLVLEISIPPEAFKDLWRGIGDQWPSYLAYVTSFLTIGALWLAHHAIFRRLRFADIAVLRMNLVLLMVVAFLPFPTRLVAEALRPAPSVPPPGADRAYGARSGFLRARPALRGARTEVAAFGFLAVAAVAIVRPRLGRVPSRRLPELPQRRRALSRGPHARR